MANILFPIVASNHRFLWKPTKVFLGGVIGVITLGSWSVSAQLTRDTTLDAGSSQMIVNGHQTLIQGGVSQGTNLFHSFLDFNIAKEQQVYFANPNGITNILSRVTGDSQSNILGTLGVAGPANLFLLNPNGILLGPHAQLDINGSFLASTADQLVFADGTGFSAVQPQSSLLTMSTPVGVQYGDIPNGNIINQGQLALTSGEQLTLFGNVVQHSGELIAPGGRIELLGHQVDVIGQAKIDVSSHGGGGTILVGGDYQGQLTRPTSGSTVVGSGTQLSADGMTTGNGGRVILWSDGITQFDGTILARGGVTGIGTAGVGNGGFVEVSGKTALVYRGQVDAAASNGLPGTLLLDPTNVTIANGSGVNTTNVLFETVIEGLSGDTNLLITATNDIVLQDLADNALDLQPGRGVVQFTADSDGDGVGAFIMVDKAADQIRTFGRDIAIMAANLQLGTISTAATPNQDAGQLLTSARSIGLASGPGLTTISGQLSTPTDVDLYEIFISGTVPFSASTVATSANAVDAAGIPNTQLFLFDAVGQGLYGNDDTAGCNCRQSTIRPTTPLPAGVYYLGVGSYATEPVSTTGNIFSDSFTTLDFTALETPLGANARLSNWRSQSGIDVGGYDITLTGVSGATSQVIEMPLSDSGSITLTATNGNIQMDTLTTAATNAGGDIRVSATGGTLDINGIINSLGVQGNGGRVSLQTTGDVHLRSGASVLTRGSLAGNLSIQSGGDIIVQGGLLSQQSTATTVTGSMGGGFEIQGQSLLLQNGAQIISETLGTASLTASQVNIQEDIVLSGSGSVNPFNPFGFLGTQVGADATGNGGTLTLEVGSLRVMDAAVVATRSFGRGNAGDLIVMGDEVVISGAVQIDAALVQGGDSLFGSELSTEAERAEEELLFQNGIAPVDAFALNEANAGDLWLDVRRLRVENGGEVSSGTHSVGDGGNLTIRANEVTVTGQMFGKPSGVRTETVPEFLGARPPEGNAGNLNIESDRIHVTDGGKITAATLALGGNAGQIQINAGDVEVVGGFVYQGNPQTSIISSEVLNAQAEAAQGDTTRNFGGRGGTLDIQTETLSLRDGGAISANTTGNGPAGDISIMATSIDLTGALTETTPSGIFASSRVEGQAAGNIQILLENQLRLRDRATIAATTQGNQGNITLMGGTVLMANGSQITTNAAGTSTGGNITLDLDLLVATPLLGNSDITANAAEGSGGQIRINSRSPILGFQVGDSDTFRAANLTPTDRLTNDITAFSQFNPAIDVGTVTIEPPVLDPTSGVLDLPTLVDASDLIVTGCPAQRGNRFTVTGQGGLPADPRQGLREPAIGHDFRLTPETGTSESPLRTVSQGARIRRQASGTGLEFPRVETTVDQSSFAEAHTWVKSVDGTIRLISAAEIYSSPVIPTGCHL